uniref:2-phosphoxylose phosphatase 1 n=1 Tax=Podarcis muralis TaxID=64176 RepID=A0A670JMX1_PODMU
MKRREKERAGRERGEGAFSQRRRAPFSPLRRAGGRWRCRGSLPGRPMDDRREAELRRGGRASERESEPVSRSHGRLKLVRAPRRRQQQRARKGRRSGWAERASERRLRWLGRKPSHPQLEAFISHMSKGSETQMDGTLSSMPRYPSHSLCEMGELTQTGIVQHLRNGQLLRNIYIKKHNLIPSDWTSKHLYLETTGKSRTLQSGLALLYSFLPEFDWKKINFRHQWSTIFCSGSCDCPIRNHYLEEEQRRQYSLRVKNIHLEKTYADMAKIVGIPTRQLRASNPVDSMLCHFCHNVSFPCTKNGCINLEHFKTIKTHQLEDEKERQEKKYYYLYALLATHPILNQTANRMQRIAEGKREELFVLYSAHDVTLSPVLSALGITEARFPRFAARLVFELWKDGKKYKEHFIRILYNGVDVTFQTSFCRDYNKHYTKLMCPLEKFVRFVKQDMFSPFNSTNYYDACHRRPF